MARIATIEVTDDGRLTMHTYVPLAAEDVSLLAKVLAAASAAASDWININGSPAEARMDRMAEAEVEVESK